MPGRETALSAPAAITPASVREGTVEDGLRDLRGLREHFTRFLMEYKFAIDEVETKISILQEEFTHLHEMNPIEHVNARLKSPESILAKVTRRGIEPTFEEIRRGITDIAGVRITCSFVSDTYRVFDMMAAHTDLRVLEIKDYIAAPKPNGYRSLHALVEVPVHLSDRIVPVTVEIQFRTVAMDFWASLEHKIHYKFDADVPESLLSELHDAAEAAATLDAQMERLHHQALGVRSEGAAQHPDPRITPDEQVLRDLAELRRRTRP